MIGGAGRDLKAALRLAPPTVTTVGDDLLIEADVLGEPAARADVHRDRRGAGDRAGVERRGDVARLEVAARVAREGSELGASVAVNGVCLTVVATAPDALRVRGGAGDARANDARPAARRGTR